jgi:hypothetical protein
MTTDTLAGAPQYLSFGFIKTLCESLRRAQHETLSLSTWAVLGEDVSTLIQASSGGDDRVIAWLGNRTAVALFVCTDCDCWRDEKDSAFAGDDRICGFCRENYSTCEDCDDLVRDEDGRSINGGDRWCCDGCAESYRTCETCGHEDHRDDMYRRDDEWYCGDHVPDDDEDDEDGVHAHEANVLEELRPAAWLSAPGENTDRHGNGKAKLATLWMGFELEVMPHGRRAEAAGAILAALDDRGILKNDGSLRDGGFEIVSLPATLAYHQTQWGSAFFDTLAAHVRGWREPTCGMHVHLSRDALTPLQIARLEVFVNGDGMRINNRHFIEKVAGRGATEYCCHYNKKLTDCAPVIERHMPIAPPEISESCDCESCRIQREAYARALQASRSSDHLRRQYRQLRQTHDGSLARACHDRAVYERYQAINLQNNATIEIRIFQSNVAQLGFLKNLDFCHAAMKFCADAGNTELYSANFLAWVDGRRGEYPNFVRWAVRENLLGRRHADAPGAAVPQIAA